MHSDFKLLQQMWNLLGGVNDEDGKEERGVAKDDLIYLLLIVKGSKMAEKEVDEEVKDETGIMKAVVLTKDDEKVKFAIRKGG